jgi:hypothetical protein
LREICGPATAYRGFNRGRRNYEIAVAALELYDRMLELHPDRANPGALWSSARAVKG